MSRRFDETYGKDNKEESDENSYYPPKPNLRDIFKAAGLDRFDAKHEQGKQGSFNFFCWLLEDEKPGEQAIKKTFIKGKSEKKGWVWPYATRMVVNSLAFTKLPRRAQEGIVRVRDKKIYWRGDRINVFKEIVRETLLWRSMNSEQKANHITQAKKKLGGMVRA